ncbi:unnamed protein product [Cyprideis torosa]|uniref:Repulsive guidance molecule C-terminal domain-containing protein n=1 Tax=Cyprideis torosa TaxID=163714 RepID=A0A7R8ZUH8_9CRUS|nr:unnamed protein product [Cyprideis torosa]CAG0906044.1 unnamed protein product [Cyprideis torosa]
MTFKGDVHTCSLEGAWPILDNEFVAIQVTTRVSERRSVACAATVATTVSVVIKAYKDCTSQMSYEGSVTSLPASFIGGHLHGGKERASMIREVIPGKHVEILLAHAEDSQLSEASFNAQNDLWSLSPEVAVGALPNRSYLLVSSPLQSRCSHPVVPSFCCLLLAAFLSVLFQSAVT